VLSLGVRRKRERLTNIIINGISTHIFGQREEGKQVRMQT